MNQGGERGGRGAAASWRVPRKLVQTSASPVPPFTPSPAFCSCCPSQPVLSVPTLCAFLVWQTWHHQHLGTVQSAAAPCGTDAKWLLADGLPADACPTDVHPSAANPTSLGREATSAYCSLLTLPTNPDCNRPLMGPSRMSQASVDREFRI